MKKASWIITIMLAIVIAGIAFGAALTADRATPRRDGATINVGVAATTKIYAGAMIAINASEYAVPAAASIANAVIGRAEEYVDNSAGTDGAKTITIGTGIYRYANHSGIGNAISDNDIGKPCYALDDQTVSLSSSDSTRPIAGRVFDVESAGVWVDMRRSEYGPSPAYVVVFANATAYENDSDGQVIATHPIIKSTDRVVASMGNATASVFINGTVVADGSATFGLSGNGGVGTQINFEVLRAK